MMSRIFFLGFLSIFIPCLAGGADMPITPFRTLNQSPLVQIFGFPTESDATVTPSGKISVSFTQDIANIYTTRTSGSESIQLDGESYRWALSARYGFAGRYEAGLEIPYILNGGGFFDAFIEDWHKTFGMSNGGRNLVPRNRLSYSYRADGNQKLLMNHAGSGIGDIRLTGGAILYDSNEAVSRTSAALRLSLKLPTGDSAQLRGSGSLDTAISLCGSTQHGTSWGNLGVFGSAGGMVMTRGNVLSSQQENIAAFGTFGAGWSPLSWLSLKLQLNANSPLFRNSSLTELSSSSLMLVSGGSLAFPGGYLLDIGVSEDIAVATAPDVALHIGLTKRF